MRIKVPISVGELIDKLTILRIKEQRLKEPAKLAAVRHELALLEQIVRDALGPDDTLRDLTGELSTVNESLWMIEDTLRDLERELDFSGRFIELARQVYTLNDRRFHLKDAISAHCGSEIREQKSIGPAEG